MTGYNQIISALVEFGFPQKDLVPEAFLSKGDMITFGVAPVRVDFINQIDGVDFARAKPGRIRGKYSNAEVYFIGKADLLQNKRSTKRTKDKADAEELSPQNE